MIYNGDFYEIIKTIDDKSVDMILTDPPYNVTRNKWDVGLDIDFMWYEFNRIIKDNGVIVIFGQDKFTAKLMLSNPNHRYNLIWKKGERTSGFLNANRMPLRNHEDIMVFYKKQPTFNPQFTIGQPLHGKGVSYKDKDGINNNYGYFDTKLDDTRKGETKKYPKSLLEYDYTDDELYMLFNMSILNVDRPHPPIHPTQKPVELGRYLIRTFTNPGDVVLDPFMGVGTFPLSAKEENRKYIGFEMDDKYFDIASERLEHKKTL